MTEPAPAVSAVRRPPGVPTRYRAEEWAALLNSCRRRSLYRFGLLLPGEFVEPFPAGEGARWFRLPVGLLLLAPSNTGRWSSCVNLEAVPLHLGPFVLRWLPPLSARTSARRARTRSVRAARLLSRGTRVAGVVAVPQDSRAWSEGGRLALSVAGAFVKQRRREVERLAKRQAVQRKGKSSKKKSGEDLFRPVFVFIEVLNSMTTELEEVAAFAWVDVEQLRSWDATTRGAALRAFIVRGMKPQQAQQLVGKRVRAWQRSKPSKARQEGRS